MDISALRPAPLTPDLASAMIEFLQQTRAGMGFAVPMFPSRRVGQTEIGGQVDDPHAALQQGFRHPHRDAVGRGEEHHVAFTQRFHARFGEYRIHIAAQVGIQAVYPFPRVGAGSDFVNLDFGVQRENAEEFHPGIASAANNACLNHAVKAN